MGKGIAKGLKRLNGNDERRCAHKTAHSSNLAKKTCDETKLGESATHAGKALTDLLPIHVTDALKSISQRLKALSGECKTATAKKGSSASNLADSACSDG